MPRCLAGNSVTELPPSPCRTGPPDRARPGRLREHRERCLAGALLGPWPRRARRQVTDHPVGVVGGSVTLDGADVLWWQDETGDESGQWFAAPFAGGERRPFLDGIPQGWNEGFRTGARRGGRVRQRSRRVRRLRRGRRRTGEGVAPQHRLAAGVRTGRRQLQPRRALGRRLRCCACSTARAATCCIRRSGSSTLGRGRSSAISATTARACDRRRGRRSRATGDSP